MEKIKSITRGQLILFLFIIVCGLGIYISVNIVKNNNKKMYESFEKELKNDAKNYINIKNISIKKGGEKRITISMLQKQKLITNDLQNKCKGYILISNEMDLYTEKYSLKYNAYIKCGSFYTTDNYSEY